MLLSDSYIRVFRVLLNNPKKTFTVRELAGEADTALAAAAKCVNELVKMNYVAKKPVKVIQGQKILLSWAYCYLINALEYASFESLERPEYLIKKIGDLGEKNKLKYAFTSSSGAELVAPYIIPTEISLYVLKKDMPVWRKILGKENIYPSMKGNIKLFFTDSNVFYKMQKIRGYAVVSNPQLFVDLFHESKEAAEYLAEKTGMI